MLAAPPARRVGSFGIARPFVASVATLALASTACGGAQAPVESATASVAHPRARHADAPSWPDEPEAWSPIHSTRFRLSIPLPDASTWSVDDTSKPELVATQPSTRSTVVVRSEIEGALVNHAKCEERARTLGLFPDETHAGSLHTVEDVVTVGPEAYDTHVRVAIEATTTDGPIRGHVLAAGAYVRKCLFVHVTTEVPTGGGEPVLSARLALARVRALGGIRVDELGAVKRESPDPR
jgi:hypothetical protein